MAFLFTWNATFEGQPADTENASLGAGRIRDLKAAISERLEIDHSWAGDASDGLHKQVTMPQLAVKPTVAANQGAFYTKDNGAGLTVPYFEDDAGTEWLLLRGGDGDKGDITVSAAGATWTIDNNVVTYAKMQDLTGVGLIGRSNAGSGDPEQIAVGTGLTLSAGTLTGVPQASSAEIAAGDNVDKYISPDLLKYGQGVAKAWVSFDASGALTVLDSFNVTSMTDVGTGKWTINWSITFGNANYAIAGFAVHSSNNNPASIISRGADKSQTTTACDIGCMNLSIALHDPGFASVIACGDIA